MYKSKEVGGESTMNDWLGDINQDVGAYANTCV